MVDFNQRRHASSADELGFAQEPATSTPATSTWDTIAAKDQ
jgi:hypothetical protein